MTWVASGSETLAAANGAPTATSAQALKSIAGVEPGTLLVTQLTDGKIWSRVERTSDNDRQT